MPHLCVALEIQVRPIPTCCSHLCKVTSCVEACTTASVLFQPSEPSMALCSPLFLFSSLLHLHMTLAIQPQCATTIVDIPTTSHVVWRPMQTCLTLHTPCSLFRKFPI